MSPSRSCAPASLACAALALILVLAAFVSAQDTPQNPFSWKARQKMAPEAPALDLGLTAVPIRLSAAGATAWTEGP
ncbi:MAG TPA: hypothetical protein P5137_18350, partial [Candidatus Brocadiia bacterium]|nr:hypothetical protein [Candidatus Brocadiia bacterium]